MMDNFKKLLVTLGVGVSTLAAEFIFQQPKIAYGMIGVFGGLMALLMVIEMIRTLRSGRYGVDILAITAIVATLLVGEYWASLLVLIMLTGGESLEDYASRQAGKELRLLLDNSPQTAHKLTKEGQLQDLAVEDVEIGDILVVKPMEIVPVDGSIITGTAMLDESSLTGESHLVEKKSGDEVMSGSLNGDQSLRLKVTKRSEDSQYQQLVKLVKDSESKPAPFVRLADRYAVPFTIIAYVIGGIAWFVAKDPVRFAEVLVVASPCPLILAAPIALVAGMSRSSRNGIIIKNGTTIEKLATSQTIAFDKTGTITSGQLSVDQIKSTGMNPEELVQLAASVEQESTHILARSLVQYTKQQKVPLLPVADLEEISGQGVMGKVQNKRILLGKASFIGEDESSEEEENTQIFIKIDEVFAGKISFKDHVRKEARTTIQLLKKLGLKKQILLTGDQKKVADEIAETVGISSVYAKCLPQDKIAYIKQLQKEKRAVIMVGDGVNDAPALSAADVGIAMGAHGATAASESADAVILKDDFTKVAQAVEIAQDTMKIAKQSVLIGIFICIVLMLIAATGVIPALLGAVFQEVIDTVAILSALRAKKG